MTGATICTWLAEGLQPDGCSPCCLTIWEVTGRCGGHTITADLVANTNQSATTSGHADLDGDGTDELFVIEGPLVLWEGDAPPVEDGAPALGRGPIRPARVQVGSGCPRPLSRRLP